MRKETKNTGPVGLGKEKKRTRPRSKKEVEQIKEEIDALRMYTKVQGIIAEEGFIAFPYVITFFCLPSYYFAPYNIPSYTVVNENAVEDAMIYCSYTSELYHKVTLLLDLIGYRDDGISYETCMEALLSTRNRIKELKDIDSYILEKYEELVIHYQMTCMLLVAPDVCPKPANPVTGIRYALQFMYSGADTLYNLAKLGDTYVSSGFVTDSIREMPNIEAAYEFLLESYCEKVDTRISSGC